MKGDLPQISVAISLLMLVLCTTSAQAQWSKPIPVASPPYDDQPDIYFAKTTNTAYVFYSHTTQTETNVISEICYKSYSFNSSILSNEKCMRLRHRVFEPPKVVGTDDGQHLYAVFSANRTLRGKECDSSNWDGCLDTYFMESANAGATWSEPIAIHSGDLRDVVRRSKTNIVYVKETKRIMIFYERATYSNRIPVFVTRPDGSTIFSSERTIADRLYYVGYRMKSGYILNGNSVIIYLFGVDSRDYSIWGEYTTDNGVRWNPTPDLMQSAYGAQFEVISSLSRDTLYLMIIRSDVYKLFVFDTEGKAQDRTIPLSLDAEGYHPILGDVSKNDKRLLLIGKDKSSTLSTFTYGVDFEELVDLKSTPPLLNYKGAITYSNETHFVVLTLHKVESEVSLSTFSMKKNGLSAE